MVSFDSVMGRHKEWRKIAKRERRRRLRVQHAKLRDDNNEIHDSWAKEQQLLEDAEYEQIELMNKIENDKWLNAEEEALKKWNRLQDEKRKMKEQQMEQEARILLEWEMEKKLVQEEEERMREIEEENKRKEQKFIETIETYLSGEFENPPKELLVLRETRPQAEPCPFFVKTGCCRFGDNCSRNHKYPTISKVLVATNFFTHFGLDNTFYNNEYDTDIMLEYEENDTYKEFQDFFLDVLPEFEKFGQVIMFKVCNNYEKHLRGNTYIEYANLKDALAAYRALHARWYGGRQISLKFCNIISWKNAICGLHFRRRCPKGRSCNFLHVFKNPNNMFHGFQVSLNLENKRSTKSNLARSWRWSESPEVEIIKTPKRRSPDRNEERKYAEKRRDDYKRRRSPSKRHGSSRRN